MQVIPAIDLAAGRSRVVFWPGAGSGVGTPTDRPERIAERFVAQGARIVHLVDVDGARGGAPANLDAVGQIASRVAIPLQLAGGLEAADHIRLAFAAGATRVVLTMSVLDEPDRLRECIDVAGDWLAIGLDARAERLTAFPWHRREAPTLDSVIGELSELGVRRVVVSHATSVDDAARVAELGRSNDLEVSLAGGVSDLTAIRQLRDLGIAAVILGEVLLSGSIDFSAAREAAA